MPASSLLTDRPEMPLPHTRPPASYDPSVAPYLTGPLTALLDGFLNTLTRTPQATVSRTEIRSFKDPEEDTTQIVVRQWVDLSPAEALEHLAAVGQQVEAWMETLSPADKALFVDRIAFQLRRDSHARSL